MDEGNLRIPFRRTLETFVAGKSTTFLIFFPREGASVFGADQRSDSFDPEWIIVGELLGCS